MVLEAIREAMGLDDIVDPLFLDSFDEVQSIVGTDNFFSGLKLM